MKSNKRKEDFDKRTELEINKVVYNQLVSFFKKRASKLQTNPAKLNLVIILATITLLFTLMFIYAFYMYFWLESLESTLSIFLLVQALYLNVIVWSINGIVKTIKYPLTLLGSLLYSVMIVIGVIAGLLQLFF